MHQTAAIITALARYLPKTIAAMFFELDPTNIVFPDASLAEPEGLLAMGGDLTPQRLLNAYTNGIFPWYGKGEPLLWWSLDPRMVLFPRDFKCSHSLQRTLKSKRFVVRVDTQSEQVMRLCGTTPRNGQDGTWVTEEMVSAYCHLHQLGLAHSFETYLNNRLVGGLYGISLGNLFFGESMFHTERDASKVAFAKLVEFCLMHSFRLIDAQQETPHLASLGAKPIPRADYLSILDDTDWDETLKGLWANHTVVLLIGGNQGNREELIEHACAEIAEKIGHISCGSPIYETEPWGFKAEQNFLNQALVVETDLAPHIVLHRALEIEHNLGRIRHETEPTQEKVYHSRPMDIDLIFYDSQIINTPDLELPHPRMHLRRFVLQPLCDIMPQFSHPILHKTIRQLLDECPDQG